MDIMLNICMQPMSQCTQVADKLCLFLCHAMRYGNILILEGSLCSAFTSILILCFI